MIDIPAVLTKLVSSAQAHPAAERADAGGPALWSQTGPLGAGALAGLAGLLMGSKRMRKAAGTALQIGAVATIGGLAYRAYQNYRQGRPVVPSSLTELLGQLPLQAGSRSERQQLADWVPGQERNSDVARLLLRTMVAAAAADGHLDNVEYGRIREQLVSSGLDKDEQLFLNQIIMHRSSIEELAAAATTAELKVEVYTAARLAIDADQSVERQWLDRLAAALGLDPALRRHLDAIGAEDRAAAA
jgi:uncharacterized membrane protein YebE (DUF533 family)